MNYNEWEVDAKFLSEETGIVELHYSLHICTDEYMSKEDGQTRVRDIVLQGVYPEGIEILEVTSVKPLG